MTNRTDAKHDGLLPSGESGNGRSRPGERVVFQGEPGANSHVACAEAFPEMEAVACPTFEDAIAAEILIPVSKILKKCYNSSQNVKNIFFFLNFAFLIHQLN